MPLADLRPTSAVEFPMSDAHAHRSWVFQKLPKALHEDHGEGCPAPFNGRRDHMNIGVAIERSKHNSYKECLLSTLIVVLDSMFNHIWQKWFIRLVCTCLSADLQPGHEQPVVAYRTTSLPFVCFRRKHSSVIQ